MQQVFPAPNEWLFDCYLLQLMKGQGRYSTGSHLSIKSRLNVKVKINKKNNTMAHEFWNSVHNDPSRSSKVTDFGTNRKRAYEFLLDINSNLGPILPCFRDIRAFVCQKPLFRYPSPIPAKIRGVPLGVDLWCWGLWRANAPSWLTVKLFSKNSKLCDQGTSTSRTGGLTTCRSNTALCVASHGKNGYVKEGARCKAVNIIPLLTNITTNNQHDISTWHTVTVAARLLWNTNNINWPTI